jgi:hypothetical protein
LCQNREIFGESIFAITALGPTVNGSATFFFFSGIPWPGFEARGGRNPRQDKRAFIRLL